MTTIIVTKSSGRLGLTCENHPKRKGALVVGLVEASTAAAAGLRVGDLIVSVNHYPVSTSKECIKHIDQSADVLQLRLACATRKVVLNKAHGCVGIETCRQPTCGVGVEVAMVVDGSPAADAGVCVGDTVLSVNGTLVRSHAQAIELVDAEDIVELVLPNDTRMVEIVKPGSGCELGVTVFNNPHGSGVVVGKLVPGGLDPNEAAFGTASRLSLFFRGSIADEELWMAAGTGTLTTPQAVRTQAARLIDADAPRFTRNFGGQWLDFRDSSDVGPLTAALKAESSEVFREVLTTNLPADQLLSPGFTFVDPTLAYHYGLSYPSGGTGVKKVMTPMRGGLLSQGGFLIHTATGSEFGRPIHRGLWTLTRLLCRSLPRLDAATLTTAASAGLRILNASPGPDNAFGDTYVILQVQIAEHQFVADRVAF